MMHILKRACCALIFSVTLPALAQSEGQEWPLQAFEFRNVGPAFLSGRIADIAIHPEDPNEWYVAVGSGGVWKTENAGTTWKPLFDGQKSYSTGCIAIDPLNPARIWVGTGENVGGRHVGYGDGIYLSPDGGNTWEHKGLELSEHISKIIVHPTNTNVVWVTAQGPLWKKGGERGVYKTTDGGTTWKQVLGGGDWTGATDMLIDPRNPDVLYAATWDRHRTVAALMSGGPGTGIYRSDDGGDSWTALTSGLPSSNMGKIGLALSPQQPDVVYAAIELDRMSGAVYRSDNRGASWTKQSETVAGGTGPHYYQELYASPHQFDLIYLMNVRVLVSSDGGKNFETLQERDKHSDNHAMAFRLDDPDYLMLGTDAGIYESFDGAQTWKYHKNLPLTQFYKVAVNNAEPFYHIFGGTQDNGSVGGPSATDEREGISNRHWYKTLFADGHQSATDPEYNTLVYAETQQGGLHRVDLITGEKVYIQPQPELGDPHERFNWDAPILVSPHNPARIYFASYRVWQSDNRGDSWTAISSDLTRNEERLELPIMGRQQSWDNAWDVYAMSDYNTITSLSESPVQEGLLYAGTDDGYMAISEDGGAQWRRVSTAKMGLPERAFVNDIKADLHDANTVYVALDNHKEGDFSPYLMKSTDRGRTWKRISSNLPERTLIWRLVQDHVNPNLLFVATEFGIYTSLNGGSNWQKLPGTPTISFRDLTIQKRENDLVAASFGRGFFVLDNYAPLRTLSEAQASEADALFAPRDAKWYIPTSRLGNTGSDYYSASNPEFGAVFTYLLNSDYSTAKQRRQNTEKELIESGAHVPFPGYDALDEENEEKPAAVWLSILDAEDHEIRRISQKASKGTHKIAWDLTHASTWAIDPKAKNNGSHSGALVVPGRYRAYLQLEHEGVFKPIGDTVAFNVVPLRDGTLQGISFAELDAFRTDLDALQRDADRAFDRLERAENRIAAYRHALERTATPFAEFAAELDSVSSAISQIKRRLDGSPARDEIGERNPPSYGTHDWTARRGLNTTYGPTAMHRSSLEKSRAIYSELAAEITRLNDEILPEIEARLMQAGAPYIKGAK